MPRCRVEASAVKLGVRAPVRHALTVLRRSILAAIPALPAFAVRTAWASASASASSSASASASASDGDALLLTDTQRAWMRAHPVVRYGIAFEARPYLIVDHGRPSGYVIDLLAKVSRLTGLVFEHVPTRGLEEAFERLARDEIDLLPLARIDAERRTRVSYTQPVATFTLGVFTRSAAPYVDDLGDLAGLRVAMPRGLVGTVELAGALPVPRPYEGTEAAIRALLDGRVDAAVAPVPVAQYWIRRLDADTVWMQATLPLRVPYGMATSPRAEPLAGILDAALRRIHVPERRALRDAWTAPVEDGTAPLQWLAPAAGLLATAGAAGLLLRRRAVRTGRDPARDARHVRTSPTGRDGPLDEPAETHPR